MICIDALKAVLVAARAEAAAALVQCSSDRALIAHLKLEIAKLKRDLFGLRSERTARLLDQMELQLEELQASATEDELAAEAAATKTTEVAAFTRKRPTRRPLPDHLPGERVVEPAPTACLCCGVARLRKLGEDVTETLDWPRQDGRLVRLALCALSYYSRDRGGEHQQVHLAGYTGILQADAYCGYGRQALRSRPKSRRDTGGWLLEPCPAQTLCSR
jgi:hypothetical protein